MKQTNFLFCSLALALLGGAPTAKAANDVGNGGDAVVCRDVNGGIQSVEFFDVFEGRERRGLTVNLNSATTWRAKVEIALQRIADLNPHRAELYRSWLEKFLQETDFRANAQLIDIADTGDAWIPARCEVEQIAVRRDTDFPGEKRYLVNADLWDQLDEDNRAALVLHELILRELMTNAVVPHGSSIYARFYNEMVLADAFATYTLRRYIEFIGGLRFPAGDLQGFDFLLYKNGKAVYPDFQYFNDQHVANTGYNAQLGDYNRGECGSINFLGNQVTAASGHEFYPNGTPKEINFSCTQARSFNNVLRFPHFNIHGGIVQNAPYLSLSLEVDLNENGLPSRMESSDYRNNPQVEGANYYISVENASVHANGHLASATVAPMNGKNLLLCNGSWKKIRLLPLLVRLFWDENGVFLSSQISGTNYYRCEDVVEP